MTQAKTTLEALFKFATIETLLKQCLRYDVAVDRNGPGSR